MPVVTLPAHKVRPGMVVKFEDELWRVDKARVTFGREDNPERVVLHLTAIADVGETELGWEQEIEAVKVNVPDGG